MTPQEESETSRIQQRIASSSSSLNEIGFRFSSEHGKGIVLSANGLEARRREAVGQGAYGAGVYIATPLRGMCEFEVEMTGTDSHIGGTLEIGVSQCQAGTNKHLEIPHEIRRYNKKDSCVWSYGSVKNRLGGDAVVETKYGIADLNYLNKGDKFAVRISEIGDLHFFVNGIDQGLAARNVYREGWDIYPAIHVCGRCTAVKITRAAISAYEHHTDHGQKDNQIDEYISPNNLQFRFHPETGKNILLLEGGVCAKMIDPCNNGDCAVYGAVPIKHRVTFEVIITEFDDNEGILDYDAIEIGVMRLPTNTQLKQSIIPKFAAGTNWHLVWTVNYISNCLSESCEEESDYGRVKLQDLRKGDKVGLRLSSDGTLSFFVNGKNQGIALRGVHQEGYNIFPIVVVGFSCRAVRITRAEILADLQDLCIEKIASCLDWSFKQLNLLPLPQRLKTYIEEYID